MKNYKDIACIRLFPTGGSLPPPLAKNLLIPSPTRKNLPSVDSPTKFLPLSLSKTSCYNPIKTSFLAVIIAPIPFLF